MPTNVAGACAKCKRGSDGNRFLTMMRRERGQGDGRAVYQWRDMMADGGGGGGRAARLRPRSGAAATPRFSLVVDLAAEPLSPTGGAGRRRWPAVRDGGAARAARSSPCRRHARGARAARGARISRRRRCAARRSAGAAAGGWSPSDRVEPLLAAPERAQVELDARLGAGDRIEALLMRIGAPAGDAIDASARMVRGAAPRGIDGGDQHRDPARQARRRRAARDRPDRASRRARSRPGHRARRRRACRDARPHPRSTVARGGFAGASATGFTGRCARRACRRRRRAIICRRWRRSSTSAPTLAPTTASTWSSPTAAPRPARSRAGRCSMPGSSASAGAPLQMLKWTVGGRTGWYRRGEPDAGRRSSALAWPVSARITSGFGMRRHPILRFARMHKGMDFGARWGSPIVASADGVVARAGWAGGYGQQVRIAHAGGIATSYSHMSRMVGRAGQHGPPGPVDRLCRLERPVDRAAPPLRNLSRRRARSIRSACASPAPRDRRPGEVARFKARLAQLLGPARRAGAMAAGSHRLVGHRPAMRCWPAIDRSQ